MTNQLKNLVTEFLEHLEIEKGRSQMTIKNYDFYLKRFLDSTKINLPEEITAEIIRQYRLCLSRQKNKNGELLSRTTQNYHLIALRNFLKYLAKRDIKTLAPEKIELAKTETRQIFFLEPNELEKLLDAPLSIKQEEKIALRDKAILELLFSAGLRVSELTNLKKEDINLNKDEFSVKGKGGKWRVVFLSSEAKKWLKKYLETRTDLDPAFFIRYDKGREKAIKNKSNNQLTPRSVQRLIKKYAKIAGITKKITTHSLRHTFATEARI